MTFNGTVSTGNDNGYANNKVGSTSLTSNTPLLIGKDASANLDDFFARWQNVTIPNGSTITTATITGRANSSSFITTCLANIYCDNEDNASAPASYSDYTGRAVTSGVAWTIPATNSGTDYTSPDFSAILQAIINRPGWVSGNALQIFVKNNGSSTSAQRGFYDFTSDSVHCPRIAIAYTPPSGPTIVVGGNAPQPIIQSTIITY